ncbi:hypothetical protein H633G_11522 [Metarhizium anisopliae BRIP 53284]|nr:hypothetical protein H633G_11522 [Metarhizium anisopliae BRIP 53284]
MDVLISWMYFDFGDEFRRMACEDSIILLLDVLEFRDGCTIWDGGTWPSDGFVPVRLLRSRWMSPEPWCELQVGQTRHTLPLTPMRTE